MPEREDAGWNNAGAAQTFVTSHVVIVWRARVLQLGLAVCIHAGAAHQWRSSAIGLGAFLTVAFGPGSDAAVATPAVAAEGLFSVSVV